MDTWHVYGLWSKAFDRLYVGMSKDVLKRVEQHNAGKQKSTKGFIPWKLIYREPCGDRINARKKEKYWKSGEGRRRLRIIAANLTGRNQTDSTL